MVNHCSLIAAEGLKFFDLLYGVERDVKVLNAEDRLKIRQEKAKPVTDALREWPLLQRSKVPGSSATAKSLGDSLKRWVALMHYCMARGCLSITICASTKSARQPWAETTGSLPGHCAPVSVPPP